MFVIKYDKVSMVRLVQSIEKHPEIYHSKIHYTKEEQDTAWDEVALEVGEKDSLCRDRWNSIKSCFIRHLKYSALNSKRKPYYLAEYLDFLQPHLADRIKSYLKSKHGCNLPTYLKEALPNSASLSLFNCEINKNKVKEEIVDVEEVSDSEWMSLTPEMIQQPSSSKVSTKRLPAKPVTRASSPKKMKTLKVNDQCKPNSTEDDDIKFFKSLLPEVKHMSDHQKLKFKQEALSIIEDILYATENVKD